MRDRPIIVSGLALLLAGVTFPFWYNAMAAPSARALTVKLPRTARQCVEPAETMRATHMRMLSAWRDRKVRESQRTYNSTGGTKYEISLTETCLKQCHESKADFCDRCHAYVGLTGPYCWDCHNAPPPAEGSAP
jgi:hypothetical protein